MAACGSCGAPIVWANTPAGKRSPIDELAVEKGNVMLIRPRGFETPLAITLSGDTLTYARSLTGVPLHLNHWATCPDKAEWRAKQEAKRAAAKSD